MTNGQWVLLAIGGVLLLGIGLWLGFRLMRGGPTGSSTGGQMVKVRVVKHRKPFQFKGVDVISIAGKMKGEIQEIPFSEEGVEVSDVMVSEEKYRTMNGVVPDEVHLFNPPGGTDGSFTARQFEFCKGRLEGVTMGIDPDYLGQVARTVRSRGF